MKLFSKHLVIFLSFFLCFFLFVFSGCFIRCWTMSFADGKLGSSLRICRNCPYQTTKRPKSNFGQSRSFIQFVLFWTCTYVFWPWTGQFLNFTINLPILIGPTTHFQFSSNIIISSGLSRVGFWMMTQHKTTQNTELRWKKFLIFPQFLLSR